MAGDAHHDATTEFTEAMASGFSRGDVETLGRSTTADASLPPPRGASADGRASAAALRLGVASRFESVVSTTMAPNDLGDAARCEAGAHMVGRADGQPVEGKVVSAWQFVVGGWQIESAIGNRDGEPGVGSLRDGDAASIPVRKRGPASDPPPRNASSRARVAPERSQRDHH